MTVWRRILNGSPMVPETQCPDAAAVNPMWLVGRAADLSANCQHTVSGRQGSDIGDVF